MEFTRYVVGPRTVAMATRLSLENFQVAVKQGELEGWGNYAPGTKYNEAKEAWWTGGVSGKIVTVREKYGNHKKHFIYGGVINKDTMVVEGNYKWEHNDAIGTFSFTFARLSRQQAKSELEEIELELESQRISEEAYDLLKKQLKSILSTD